VAGVFGEAQAAYLQAQALALKRPENAVFLAMMSRTMSPRSISRAEQDAMIDLDVMESWVRGLVGA